MFIYYAGVVENTHEHEDSSRASPAASQTCAEKDSTVGTLMDLYEKTAYGSGILADVTLNPHLDISAAVAPLELVLSCCHAKSARCTRRRIPPACI